MDEQLKAEILKKLELEGSSSEENAERHNIILGSRNNLNHIINLGDGRAKIRKALIPKFQFIIGQPKVLAALSPFEIRCCLCKRVISYPAWYYRQEFVINHLHFFVCFDPESRTEVTARCYKRFSGE